MMVVFVDTIAAYIAVICQLLAATVISVGVVKAFILYFQHVVIAKDTVNGSRHSRLELGESFSLGLGFLIGASIITSINAPEWNDIGKLAAIVGIRAVLNFFLRTELERYYDDLCKETTGENGSDKT